MDVRSALQHEPTPRVVDEVRSERERADSRNQAETSVEPLFSLEAAVAHQSPHKHEPSAGYERQTGEGFPSGVLDGLAAWTPANGEALFGTRSFTVFGEGAPDVQGSANFNGRNQALRASSPPPREKRGLPSPSAGPDDGKLRIQTLADGSKAWPKGDREGGPARRRQASAFSRSEEALVVTLPEQKPHESAWVLEVS